MKNYFNSIPEIKFVAIFGSIARKGSSYHDIDIVVKIEDCNKNKLMSKIIHDLSNMLNIDYSQIDLIDIDTTDFLFKKKILENCIVIVDRGYLKNLINEIISNYEVFEYWELSIRELFFSKNSTGIDIDVIKKRIDFIKSEIEFLKQYVLSKDINEVINSPILKRLLERSFQLIVEAIINICRHIISAKGWDPAYTVKDFIEKCCEKGIINKELFYKFVNFIRLRNIIVHRYLEINYNELYQKTIDLINSVKKFEEEIIQFLRKELGYTMK